MRTRATLLFCLALTTPLPALGANIRVPQDEASIQAAVTAAVNGDVIKIGKGRWEESIVTAKELTLVGKKGTIWDGFVSGSQAAQLTCTANNVVVKNIEFQNGLRAVSITGDDAKVSGCKFRSCADGVWVDGARARVQSNDFYNLQGSDFTIEIYGPDASVTKNKMVNNYYAGIYIDAEGGGTAKVMQNVMDSCQDYMTIDVNNAGAPKIKKNKIMYGYLDGKVINASNCDDAEICGNKLMTINYDVTDGIHVTGERAVIDKNVIDTLNDYDSSLSAIYVSGNDAIITRNKLRGCNAGADTDTFGVGVNGNGALVEKNSMSDMGGGGEATYGVEVVGNNCSVNKSKMGRFNDEYTYGIFCTGNGAEVKQNRFSNFLDGYVVGVIGDDFMIMNNSFKGCAYNSASIGTTGNATGGGTARIESNTMNSIAYDAIDHDGDGVWIRYNKMKYIGGTACTATGNNNTLHQNNVTDCLFDAFLIEGDGNNINKCVATRAGKDGFDIDGAGNAFNECKATDCVAEGFDNSVGSTGTIATACTFKKSRLDYCGNGNMANDAGTVYGTGGPGQAPEID